MSGDDLLAGVLEAHGGLDNWRQTTSMTAELTLGGPFWAGRGWPVEFAIAATLETQREHIELTYPDRVATFDVEPERLTLRSATGEAIETRDEPRASFPPVDRDSTRWDAVQVAYFQCTASWNSLTAPFVFAGRGVGAHEIASWDEDGETWRRLAVLFPPSNANHNPDQVFYYDGDLMLRRMDYAPEVTGSPPVAHYTYDPVVADGFVFPTRRRVHLRDADGVADKRAAVSTDDIRDISIRRDGDA